MSQRTLGGVALALTWHDRKYRDAGYGLEILYVVRTQRTASAQGENAEEVLYIAQYAGLDVMIERAKRRAQSTGRVSTQNASRASPH